MIVLFNKAEEFIQTSYKTHVKQHINLMIILQNKEVKLLLFHITLIIFLNNY